MRWSSPTAWSWCAAPASSTRVPFRTDCCALTESFPVCHDQLAVDRPDVEATISWDPDSLPIPGSVPAAAKPIDEFVVASDTYPLTTPIPPLATAGHSLGSGETGNAGSNVTGLRPSGSALRSAITHLALSSY